MSMDEGIRYRGVYNSDHQRPESIATPPASEDGYDTSTAYDGSKVRWLAVAQDGISHAHERPRCNGCLFWMACVSPAD